MSLISIMALYTATDASDDASENKKKICKLTVNSFNNKLSTVKQKQGYADCVETLYPQKMNAEHVLGLKILFMVGFIIFVLIGIYNFVTKKSYERVFGVFMKTILFNACVWGIIVLYGTVILGFIWVVISGLIWVFN